MCPECNGPLWETQGGASLQFRCHVGHAYSPDSQLADHADGLERALWSAVRTFDERAALLRRLEERKYHSESVGTNAATKAKELERHADSHSQIAPNRAAGLRAGAEEVLSAESGALRTFLGRERPGSVA